MVEFVPKLLDIVKLPKEIEDLPKTTVPYWVAAREGIYLNKNTPIGRCLLLEDKVKLPNSFNTMGDFKNGYFRFEGPKLSKHVFNQAYSFFRKVFESNKLPNHKNGHCEAEVFILRNTKNEYSLFIPWQYTSYSGVNSLYDQADIPEDCTIIGTIHSHCDFDAFHSTTDEADASDFNGMHITIGHVNTDKPSVASMIMMNGIKFNYTIQSIMENADDPVAVVDFPENWLTFIYDDVDKIVNRKFATLTAEELAKFVKDCTTFVYSKTKPIVNDKAIVSLARAWGYNDDNDDWRNWRSDKEGSYLERTRWSDEFRRSFPVDWFQADTYGAKLTPQGFQMAIEKELNRLFEMASEHGFYLDFAIENLYESLDSLTGE